MKNQSDAAAACVRKRSCIVETFSYIQTLDTASKLFTFMFSVTGNG